MDPQTASFGLADVEVLAEETCYDGFLKIDRLQLRCRLFEGGWSKPFSREVMLREPGVGVLLYDPERDKILMVEQFRVGCMGDAANGPWALELVAGLVDTEESIEEVAIRETEEEAGITITSQLLPISEYYNSPGGSAEKLTIFCARFDSRHAGGVHGLEDESEDIKVVVLDRQQAFSALQQGRINNAMSIIALQWLQLNLEQVRMTLIQQ